MNPTLRALVALGLVGLGLVAAVLTIGAFGQTNPNNPIPILSSIEGGLSGALHFLTPNGDTQKLATDRGFAFMGFTLVFTALAALLVSSPKSEQLTFPGGRENRSGRATRKEA